MFETLINPRKAERKPYEMFLIGLVYASIATILVNLFFLGNSVFTKSSGILIITFTVMLSFPFMYYIIKLEESKDERIRKEGSLIKEHSKALLAFIYLFLGFTVAFSLWYIFLPTDMGQNFQIQVEQYCAMNMPNQFKECTIKYSGVEETISGKITSSISAPYDRAWSIFKNNIYVLIFCIVFSLLFGVGAIFILTWNASVIATAIGIFTRGNVSNMPTALLRYMIHGLPEIAAYFTAGLAGGIISVAMIKHEFGKARFLRIVKDSLYLIALAILILIAAALIEVFITPALF